MGSLGISIIEDDSNYNKAFTENSPTVIKVVGCGGGGSNAVNRNSSKLILYWLTGSFAFTFGFFGSK